MLDVVGLARNFGKREVVRSLSLQMGRGARVALTGSNGSGKSTVLRCVAGTLTPTRGRVSVCGHAAGTVQARSVLGASLALERSFYLRLSGLANLVLFARLRGLSASEAEQDAATIVRELELESFAPDHADTYSAGMLQQLAFARALLGKPALLLLDEPTRSLDESAVARFWRALDRRPETTVLLATHNRDDIDHCHGCIELPI